MTSPPVIAAAIMKVPASIRSGMTLTSQGLRLSTPSMVMTSVPAPLIFAPMALSVSARFTTSGSLAAFSSRVVPFARAAAIMIFSVPPTVEMSK